jgi:hypothetical protein
MASHSLQGLLSKNRAEELDLDVWQHFVVPPFFEKLDLYTARKPRVILGGRGCGKTMLLRYLSHQSTFSRLRKSIPLDTISHIGLYWRADTHFLNLFTGRGVDDDRWHSAFLHSAAIILGIEVLASLHSVAVSSCLAFDEARLDILDFSKLKAFDADLPHKYTELRAALEQRLWSFQAWVNNARKLPEPTFLAGEVFVAALIREIQSQIPELQQANYFVYIDEYENLKEWQQRIVNTWLKHSQIPLIFNLAMKRNSMRTQQTTGPESLTNIHDFRIHDLEALLDDDFSLFAAEILFLNLSLANQPTPVEPSILRSPDGIRARQDPKYRDGIRTAVRALFPDMTHREMAERVFSDAPLTLKLRQRVRQALSQRGSQLNADDFVLASQPEASIVSPSLLFRTSLDPSYVRAELRKLDEGDINDFTGSRDWIHNNFVGSYLQLYGPHSKPCPLFAGFQTFCQLAHGNIRYLLELCHTSLNRMDDWDGQQGVPIDVQADAAREASASFLREVRSSGPKGLQLHGFVLRLGSLLAIAHQRPTQSEPEQTHFSIGAGSTSLTNEDQDFLREAVKWSVIYEEPETKKKDVGEPEGFEYVLAPIYAPYFHISYRKKRKLKLSTDDVIVLVRGSYEQVKELLRRYSAAWEVEPSELAPTLFSHLGDEFDENQDAGSEHRGRFGH